MSVGHLISHFLAVYMRNVSAIFETEASNVKKKITDYANARTTSEKRTMLHGSFSATISATGNFVQRVNTVETGVLSHFLDLCQLPFTVYIFLK